jgi:hypothetical protein
MIDSKLKMVVGVIRDEKLKLQDLNVSHTLGWSGGRGDLRIGVRFDSVRGEFVIRY